MGNVFLADLRDKIRDANKGDEHSKKLVPKSEYTYIPYNFLKNKHKNPIKTTSLQNKVLF